MSFPSNRFFYSTLKSLFAIHDSHLLPKGWFNSTYAEKDNSIVYIEPYVSIENFNKSYENMISKLNEYNRSDL